MALLPKVEIARATILYIKRQQKTMYIFGAKIEIIGINPFVFIPGDILRELFKRAGKDKGHIPINGTVNGKPYRQTLVKYAGVWRLYINTTMLKNSPKRLGETIEIKINFDPRSREIKPPVSFLKALKANKKAEAVFDDLPAHRKSEIVRYLANLKTPEALERNIERAINFLSGKERFIGRDKP